ncbi:MAG: prolyl oligopeptidase family serine peptidase [Bacillota bacterium]
MTRLSAIHIPDAPHTPRKIVTDIVHGVKIDDPYRWLEDGQSPETRAWTEAQNQRTEAVMQQLPARKLISRRLTELMSQETVGSPHLCGNQLFYMAHFQGKSQPVLMVIALEDLLSGATSRARILVDPNKESQTGIVALDWWNPSADGSMLAYGLSKGGDEWSVLHIMEVATGKLLPEKIKRTRYAGVTWRKDNTGFYYGRYPQPGEVPPGEENYNRHIFYHKLGTDPANDPKIYGEGCAKELSFGTSFSKDGHYLLLHVSHGWRRTDLYYRDETDSAGTASPFLPLVEGIDAHFYGGIIGETLYVLTNYQASRYRIVAIDLKNPAQNNWRTIIPESDDLTIENVAFAKGHIIISGLKHAVSHLYVYDLHGQLLGEVPLPTLGAVTGLTADPESDDFFLVFESFLIPPAIYRCTAAKGTPLKPEMVLTSAEAVDPNLVSIEQVFYPSKDGTKIPMFILKRRDLPVSADNPHPTVLFGYGGFNISKTPTYMPAIVPWIESGGIYASANLRGGSEYGEDWHRAGMQSNKQNVFDDYIAAGEYLISKGYTDHDHFGVWGRSNGGLLVGATLTQRPDLMKAVACGVPLLDMVRYHKFLIAYLWCSEYGNPDDPEAFKWLYAYSPYHHVHEDVTYPAIYTYTAESDTRVDPLHAKKMTALLQHVDSITAAKGPILLQVEADAGHGVGKPLHKIVAEQANMWAFLAWQLGLDVATKA